MRGRGSEDKSYLVVRQGFFAPGPWRTAQAALIRHVFDDDTIPSEDVTPWRSVAAFEPSGRCVASVEARTLPLSLDGVQAQLTGVRRVGVDPDWRGRGLVRDLLGPALQWCDARAPYPTLLYAEAPDLYARFGFVPLAQHAFVGIAPAPSGMQGATPLDPRRMDDAGIIRRLLADRVPLSRQCALAGAEDLVFDNILALEDVVVAHATALDAIVLYETNDADLTLVDVIAGTIPPLAAILGALGVAPRSVRTLFPPDRLAWSGEPQVDDTGLMSRGALPAAMTRPFMLPPTAEF